MDAQRRKAKQYLKKCNRKQYDSLVSDAYLTNRQLQIAEMKKADNMPSWEIANVLSISPETVTRELANIYDKILSVIL